MNNELYRGVFSNVHPSDTAIERIMNMTEKKKKRYAVRTVAVIAAVISALFVSGIIVNAATDGALKESAAAVAESIKQKFNLTINGKTKDASELTPFESELVNEIVEDLPETEGKLNIQIEGDENNGCAAVVSVESDTDYSYTETKRP